MALQQMGLDIDESLKVISMRPEKGTLIILVSKPGLHIALSLLARRSCPCRSLCPHSPSLPPKPDYCLSIYTRTLLLIKINLLVIEHMSSFFRPAKTGAALPQTITHLRCPPFMSFATPATTEVATELLSRSTELLNGHSQPSGAIRH